MGSKKLRMGEVVLSELFFCFRERIGFRTLDSKFYRWGKCYSKEVWRNLRRNFWDERGVFFWVRGFFVVWF